MSTFTLAISYLTTSNLPWFIYLTFQIPMQYCSLQHRTLLLSPVTSTAGYCFCFGSIASFFRELFLQWSPVAYCAPTHLGSSSFSIISFCLFVLFMGFSRLELLKWFAIPYLNNMLKKQLHYFVNKGPSSQGYGFSSVMYGCESWTVKKAEQRRIDVLNCGVGQDSWESLGLQGDPTSPS